MSALAAQWLSNPWLCWGVGPLIATNLGYWVPAAVLELLLASGWCDSSAITYASTKAATRKQLLQATQQRIPLATQVYGSFLVLLGPRGFLNALVMTLVAQLVALDSSSWLPPTWTGALAQFLALLVLADFGLYWGHRVQHEVPALWRYHSKHHAVDTPSPSSTLYLHPTDAALQGSIPFLLAALAVRPAPLVLYLFLAFRICENVVNHSGIDHWLFDLVTLRLLPFRAAPSFHDAHHKYSNYQGNAKNYGESFWVWDWVFGTTSSLRGRAASTAEAATAAAAIKAQ